MIIIDFLEKVFLENDKTVLQPRLYKAESFLIVPIEHHDNEKNTEMNEINRNLVTRTTYSIWATCVIYGEYIDMMIQEYETETDALDEYNKICDAISYGDIVYKFKKREAKNAATRTYS